jgi:hypothetical protein
MYARRWLWQEAPRFATLDELNDWEEQRCQALLSEIQHPSSQGSVAETAQAGRLPTFISRQD